MEKTKEQIAEILAKYSVELSNAEGYIEKAKVQSKFAEILYRLTSEGVRPRKVKSKIAEKIRERTPLRTKIEIDLKASDIENWDNGEYKGHADKYTDTVLRIIDKLTQPTQDLTVKELIEWCGGHPDRPMEDEYYEDGVLESCPNCGRSYDHIDFDFQSCSKCGWDDTTKKFEKPREPDDEDYDNGDADIITGMFY